MTKKIIDPEFYTIDTVPAPTEPMGIGMQRLAAELAELDLSWLEEDEEPNDEELNLTLNDVLHIAAARLASTLNQ